MDHWYEEDEEVFVHPRDPYHRIDVLASGTARSASRSTGELLAESDRALALFESNLPTRWYLPREDVVAALEPTDTITRCPYKGDGAATTRSPASRAAKDLVWYYAEPFAEVGGSPACCASSTSGSTSSSTARTRSAPSRRGATRVGEGGEPDASPDARLASDRRSGRAASAAGGLAHHALPR